MNKKLIAAAIAAALAAPAAYADATVYGIAKLSISSVDNGGESMQTDGSRLGFKGDEDLGNGMKALYKLEWALQMDEGAGIAKSRSQYVGLAGNFGTVMFGKRETNYLLSTVALDMFGDTMADYNNTIGFEEGGAMFAAGKSDARPNDAIHYVSPTFSGLTISAGLYGNDTELDSGYDIAAVYENAGIHASIAYSDADATDSAMRIGLGYKMDAITVNGIYESQSSDNDAWQIQAAYAMGNNTIKAMYGDNDAAGDSWAIGVDHKLSKRTKVYALYADSERDLATDADGGTTVANDGFAIGMTHNF